MTTQTEAMNIATQCRATASDPLAKKILVDGGSGFLAELLLDAAKAIEALAEQPAQQEPDAIGCKCSECGKWQRWTPSGMTCKNGHGGAPGINHRLYTTPQPQAQPLTDEQLLAAYCKTPGIFQFVSAFKAGARYAETAHGITKGNT